MNIFEDINNYYNGKEYVKQIELCSKSVKVVFNNNLSILFTQGSLIDVYIDDKFYYDIDEQDIIPFLIELEDSTIVFLKKGKSSKEFKWSSRKKIINYKRIK